MKHVEYPPLRLVTQSVVPTDQAAFYLNRAPKTLRAWGVYGYGADKAHSGLWAAWVACGRVEAPIGRWRCPLIHESLMKRLFASLLLFYAMSQMLRMHSRLVWICTRVALREIWKGAK